MNRKAVAFNGYQFSGITGEVIEKMTYGVPEGYPFRASSYQNFTLTMKSGCVFVISQLMGEVNIDEVVP